MSKELERIKVYVQEQTAELAENVRAELLDALAWWASEEAGSSISSRRTPKITTNNAGQV